MSKIFFSLFLVGILVLAALVSINLFYQAPLQSAISGNSRLRYLQTLFLPSQNKAQVVYGFLPYWNIERFQLSPGLTHLSFFSLTIAADGSIITRQNGGTEPGYRHLGSDKFLELAAAAREQGAAVELTFTQFNNNDIAAFLRSDQAQANFLTALDSILLAYPISGINIDIEYSGSGAQELQAGLTAFMRQLHEHAQARYPDLTISIDVYASAATNQQIWHMADLADYVDYIVIMAYDFHQRGSTQAGPVAPLFGENSSWSKNINHNLKKFLEQVPREKLLLGVPFYGYGWQTDSNNPRANTYEGTGFTVSYQKAKALEQQAETGVVSDQAWAGASQIKRQFDEDALSPFITYRMDDKFYTIYYENPLSLTYKMEYARHLDLAGIAIWALGYEDQEGELWGAIGEYL